MNFSTLLQQVYTKYRGKIASKTPAFGSEKANVVLEIANSKVSEWAMDSNQVWTSLFNSDVTAMNQPGTVATTGTETLTGTGTYFTDYAAGDKITVSGETVRTIATITSDTVLTVTVAFTNTASALSYTRRPIIATGVQEYTLHRSFFVPSDKIVVTTTQASNPDVPFTLAKPQMRDTANAYISGINPKKVTFYSDIESTSQIVGGTLKVPGYYLPDNMVLATDLVAVDDPIWLVYATAAELARNDPAKEGQFANLLGMANDRYSKMISANLNIGYKNGGRVPYNMNQIGDQTDVDSAF